MRVVHPERAKLTPSLRFEILDSADGRCNICGASVASGALLHVDHIVPLSRGGKTERGNLRALCMTCNIGKGVSAGPRRKVLRGFPMALQSDEFGCDPDQPDTWKIFGLQWKPSTGDLRCGVVVRGFPSAWIVICLFTPFEVAGEGNIYTNGEHIACLVADGWSWFNHRITFIDYWRDRWRECRSFAAKEDTA